MARPLDGLLIFVAEIAQLLLLLLGELLRHDVGSLTDVAPNGNDENALFDRHAKEVGLVVETLTAKVEAGPRPLPEQGGEAAGREAEGPPG